MICHKCGKPVSGNARFCQYCGSSLVFAGEKKTATESYLDADLGKEPGTESRFREATGLRMLRKMAVSKLYMTAVISFTASIALRLLAAASSGPSITGYLNQLLQMVPEIKDTDAISMYLYQYANRVSTAAIFTSFLLSLPDILTAVALWLVFSEAKKGEGSRFSTTGFSILRGVAIFHVVVTILAGLIILIAAVGVMTAFSGIGSDGRGVQEAVLIAILMLAAVAALVIMYYWKIQKMLSTSKRIASDGIAEQTGSAYVGALTMVGAVGNLPAFITAPGMGKLQALAAGISGYCFAMLLFSFRNSMETAAQRQSKRWRAEREAFPEYRPEEEDGMIHKDGQTSSRQSEMQEDDPERRGRFFENEGTRTDDSFGMYEMFEGEDTVVEDPGEDFYRKGNGQNGSGLPTWVENDQGDEDFQDNTSFSNVSSVMRTAREDPFRHRRKPVMPENTDKEAEIITREEAAEAELRRTQEEATARERERAEQERRAREEAAEEELRRTQEEAAARERERAEQERRVQENLRRQENENTDNQKESYRTIPSTTELSARPKATLIRCKDGLQVTLMEPRLRIGRNPREVDFLILDNPAIGRHHADIVLRNGEYFIIDQNSTNHVFVNGVLIPKNQEYPLQNQDAVRLADDEFLFRTDCGMSHE